MEISIGAYDKGTRTVPVTFTQEGKEPWQRPVNAVLDAKGNYDRTATRRRVEDELAPGVAVKFDLGLIGNPPVLPEAPAP